MTEEGVHLREDDIDIGLEELEKLNLSPDAKKLVVDARLAARRVVLQIDPAHISSLADLLARLEAAVSEVRTEHRLFNFTTSRDHWGSESPSSYDGERD